MTEQARRTRIEELKGKELEGFGPLIEGYFAGWSYEEGAVESGDARRFYATDPGLIFYDTQPPVEGFLGVDGLHEGVQGRAGGGGVKRVLLAPIPGAWRAWRLGDVAWTLTPYHITATTEGGHTAEFGSRETHVWEKRDGAWLDVHEHTAPPLSGSWTGAPSQTAGVGGLPGPSEPEFERFVDDLFAAWAESATLDPEKAEAPARFYSEGPETVIVEPGSEKTLDGWSAFKDARAALYRSLRSMRLSRRGGVRAWRRGELAWITFLFHASLDTNEGERREFVGRQTDVLERRGGGWRIVHEHASVPIPEGAVSAGLRPRPSGAARSERSKLWPKT